MLHIHDDNLLFLVLYGFLEHLFLLHELNFSRDSWFLKRPHTEHGREKGERTFQHNTGTQEPLIWIRALQQPPEPERLKSFLNYWTVLLSRIAHSGPRFSWSGRKKCRCTNISVFNQRLNLECRELHTGDNIPPNNTIILLLGSRGGTRAHGWFQCLDVLASVPNTPLNTIYERTLRTYRQVSTSWHLQIHLSLQQSKWGREFTAKANNTTAHIQAQHRRLKLPLEVEDSVNTVLELMLCFPAHQQTCMAGIKYFWSALLRPASGVSVMIFTDHQTRSVLSVAMRTWRLHGYQRTPWDPRPSVFTVPHNAEMKGKGLESMNALP